MAKIKLGAGQIYSATVGKVVEKTRFVSRYNTRRLPQKLSSWLDKLQERFNLGHIETYAVFEAVEPSPLGEKVTLLYEVGNNTTKEPIKFEPPPTATWTFKLDNDDMNTYKFKRMFKVAKESEHPN